MTHVWIVEWAYNEDPPTLDSVWSTEALATERTDYLSSAGDRFLTVWVRRCILDAPRGVQ
jgi:hypothetical protein